MRSHHVTWPRFSLSYRILTVYSILYYTAQVLYSLSLSRGAILRNETDIARKGKEPLFIFGSLGTKVKIRSQRAYIIQGVLLQQTRRAFAPVPVMPADNLIPYTYNTDCFCPICLMPGAMPKARSSPSSLFFASCYNIAWACTCLPCCSPFFGHLGDPFFISLFLFLFSSSLCLALLLLLYFVVILLFGMRTTRSSYNKCVCACASLHIYISISRKVDPFVLCVILTRVLMVFRVCMCNLSRNEAFFFISPGTYILYSLSATVPTYMRTGYIIVFFFFFFFFSLLLRVNAMPQGDRFTDRCARDVL